MKISALRQPCEDGWRDQRSQTCISVFEQNISIRFRPIDLNITESSIARKT